MSSLDAIFGPKRLANQTDSDTPRTEARVEQLLALNSAAIAIASELELDYLLQRIVDIARELIGCKYAALGILGEDGLIARFPTSGISKTEQEQIGARPRGHGLLGVMLRAGQSLRIPDMSKDARRVGFPPHHRPMTSLLGVPIFALGKLVGDLYLSDKIDEPEFSEEDEWLVHLLATHAATALTNAGLHAEKTQALGLASRERATSDALFRASRAINRSVHLDEVIQLIVQSALDLLNAAGAAVYLLKQATPEGETGLASGNSAGSAAPSREGPNEARGDLVAGDTGNAGDASHIVTQGTAEQKILVRFVARYASGLERSFTSEPSQLPADWSLAGRAASSGMTQVVDDTSQEPDLVLPRLVEGPLRSALAVPLLVGQEHIQGQVILGVLSAYSDQAHAFDREAVRLLEAFGEIASIAIHNTSLYEEAQRGREAAEREGQRLRELEQMKDEFLSTAAHELRTPLTTILMSAGLAHEQLEQIATSKGIDPRIVDLVELVVEGSQRMQSLVNDLLDLTRLEQGRATFTYENLDLREVVSASVESVAPLFESRNQQLDVRVPEFQCVVKGDRPRLERVLINLLSNANKYSPLGTQLEIRIISSKDECLVAVRDAGPGVPDEERERIFERFYRSSLHRNDRAASSGLGLPIARKIAEMHKGRLWVDPAPIIGSIFSLALPRADF